MSQCIVNMFICQGTSIKKIMITICLICRSNLLTKNYELKWWEQSILIKEVSVYLINYFSNANINFHFLFIKLIKSFFSLYQ